MDAAGVYEGVRYDVATIKYSWKERQRLLSVFMVIFRTKHNFAF